jgi:hypothetical protein
MTLRFIYFKTSEPQNTKPQPATSSPRRARSLSLSMAAESNFEGQIRLVQSFFKIDRIPDTMLDVQRSMFDVHLLVNLSYKTNQGPGFFGD